MAEHVSEYTVYIWGKPGEKRTVTIHNDAVETFETSGVMDEDERIFASFPLQPASAKGYGEDAVNYHRALVGLLALHGFKAGLEETFERLVECAESISDET